MFHNIFGDGSCKGNADPKEPFIFYKVGRGWWYLGGQLKKYALKGEGGVTENITLFKASAAERTFCPK